MLSPTNEEKGLVRKARTGFSHSHPHQAPLFRLVQDLATLRFVELAAIDV
jgi:hypothetical protein